MKTQHKIYQFFQRHEHILVLSSQRVTSTLENAIKKNKLGQALLFSGPRGVGKTTCARILGQDH